MHSVGDFPFFLSVDDAVNIKAANKADDIVTFVVLAMPCVFAGVVRDCVYRLHRIPMNAQIVRANTERKRGQCAERNISGTPSLDVKGSKRVK